MTPAIQTTTTGLTAAGYNRTGPNHNRHAFVPQLQQPGRLGETTLPSENRPYFFNSESG